MKSGNNSLRETARIGIFLCHCGLNIGGVVNIPEVLKHAKKLPDVVYAEENLYTCSAEGINSIKEAITKYNLNRVVVASCTPRTHESLFRATCQEMGLNKYLFEMANIREHCSWVHMHEPERATGKAKDIVSMAVAKARLLRPQEEPEVEVDSSTLVIGAGVSGMNAALSLANQGFKVYLVEKEAEIGGIVRKLHKLYPTGQNASDYLEPLVKAVRDHENITLLTSTFVKDVKGYIGNFDVTATKEARKEVKFKTGTILVATGAVSLEPEGMYGYGKYHNVITQLQLEHKLRTRELKKPERVLMIQCVGAREEKGRTYCSRICCMVAIKNAILIKELYPDADVYILYRDLQTYGDTYEEFNLKARDIGIKFIEYLPRLPPQVSLSSEGKLNVEVHHALLGEEITFCCDLVVLSTPLMQHQAGKELSNILKVPLGPNEFFLEAHVKLRPVDFATDGMYLCGTAHGPKDIAESVSQAYGAASRAAIPMSKRKVSAEAITAVVDEELCFGCELCVEYCPYGAIKVVDRKSKIVDVVCKGCGVCAAACPQRAITMRHFEDKQVLAQIMTAF